MGDNNECPNPECHCENCDCHQPEEGRFCECSPINPCGCE